MSQSVLLRRLELEYRTPQKIRKISFGGIKQIFGAS